MPYIYTPNKNYLQELEIKSEDLFGHKIDNGIGGEGGLYAQLKAYIESHSQYMEGTEELARKIEYIAEYLPFHYDEAIASQNAEKETFVSNFQQVRKSLKDYVRINKKKISQMSDGAYQFYRNIENMISQLEPYDSAVNQLISGHEKIQQLVQDLNNGSEEKKIAEQYHDIGMHGIRPTIHECLTMTVDNTDMKTVFSRFLWLAHSFENYQDNDSEEHKDIDMTAYGVAYERLGQEISNMSFDKQVDFLALMYRHLMALNDLGEKKYKQILEHIPKDRCFHDPEYQLLAAKRMLQKPAYAEIRNEIDKKFPDQGKNRNDQILKAMKDMPDFSENLREVTRENLAIMEFCKTEEYQALCEYQDAQSRIAAGGGRMADLGVFLMNRGFKNYMDNRSSAFIGVFMAGAISDLRESFQNSTVEERKAMYQDFISSQQEKAAEFRAPIISSPVFRQLNAMAENYLMIAGDTRKASSSFKAVKDSMKKIFSEEMKNINNVKALSQFFEDVEKARKSIKAYRDSHSLHPHSERGQQRMAWTAPLENSLLKMERAIRQHIGRMALKEASKVMKDANSSENILKVAYARMIFYNIEHEGTPDSQEEREEFLRFMRSELFQSAYAEFTSDKQKISEFAEAPTIKNLNKEIDVVKKINDELKANRLNQKQLKAKESANLQRSL